MQGSMISIKVPDGSFAAYYVPTTKPRAPGLVVLQEIYGINEFMRHACVMFAEAGYNTLCPDLFWRQEPGVSLSDGSNAELERAFALLKGFDADKAVVDIQAAIDHLRMMPNCTRRVGAVGYCLGGLLAYLAMCRTNADCASGYYGSDIENRLQEATNIRRPLMLHIAEADSTMTPEAIAQLKAGLRTHPCVTLHGYDGIDHGFARVNTKYFKYDDKSADLANQRTFEFFKSNLS